jgi:RNA polymerase sigma factor (sigma-70 family)
VTSLFHQRADVSEGIDLHFDAIRVWSIREAYAGVDPSDLAQQAVLALLQAKAQNHAPMNRAYAVIRAQGAIKNAAAHYCQFIGRHRALSPVDERAAGPQSTDTGARSAGLKALLQECVKDLPAVQQQVITGLYIEELSNQEVAVKMQMSESRICKLHQGALAKMRGMLEERRIHTSGEAF